MASLRTEDGGFAAIGTTQSGCDDTMPDVAAAKSTVDGLGDREVRESKNIRGGGHYLCKILVA